MKSDAIRTGTETANRLSAFGGAVIRLCETFPKSKPGRHVVDQLVRSASSPGAHYAEARGAHSKKEFVYRLSLALKELREALHWLRLAGGAGWLESELDGLLDEGTQLVRILAASKATAQNRDRSSA